MKTANNGTHQSERNTEAGRLFLGLRRDGREAECRRLRIVSGVHAPPGVRIHLPPHKKRRRLRIDFSVPNTTDEGKKGKARTMSYARMVIGELINEEQIREFQWIFNEKILPILPQEQGFQSSQMLIEEGGNMVISMTTWDQREDCLRYHSSRNYRRFVKHTQHLLVGEFVVKLFNVPTM